MSVKQKDTKMIQHKQVKNVHSGELWGQTAMLKLNIYTKRIPGT